MITVFTPTYNRAYILPKLYESLSNQTIKNFEWLIVDDGSTDDTEILIKSFISKSNFPILYFKKENEGKHIAINFGTQKAKGNLFFIVDSDDFIAENTIEYLEKKYKEIKDNKLIAGIGLGCYSIKNNGRRIYSKEIPNGEILLTHNELVYQYNIIGDFATAFKTDIQRKYPYPQFKGETFFRESYVYRLIGKKYKTLYVGEKLYFADYLDDGLTSKSWQLLKKCPYGASFFFKELSKENIPLSAKLSALNAYWDFQLNDIESSIISKFKGVNLLLSAIVLFNRKFKIIKL